MTKNHNFFFNDVEIQLILEFKISFEKYHQVLPKNLKGCFFGHPVCMHRHENLEEKKSFRYF